MESDTRHHPLKRLLWSLVLNALIIIGEFSIGLWIHSVGLMTDAWHNLIDQGSLFLTLYAYVLGARPPTERQTYGYGRAGVLAAFANAVILIAAAVALAAVAIGRLTSPAPVAGAWVMGTSLLAFGANYGIALLLRRGARDDINLRGAFWHMLGDAWVSFGVAAGGLLIWLRGWTIVDPMISLVIVVVILKGAFSIVRECVRVLMESAPPGLKPSAIVQSLRALGPVQDVHDLHLWEIKPGQSMMSGHVLVTPSPDQSLDDLRRSMGDILRTHYGVSHATIQIETQCAHTSPECDLEPPSPPVPRGRS
ncbi:MAG TPA: cation diffusion facilitator family transporter [Elusimicrobiota bacterium]|nr:cation diffusion facilitator family transporter [Elusimicrobiota bacterium]